MRNAFLEVTSWEGSSVFWAVHHYGKLHFGSGMKDRVEVQFTLSAEDAKDLNREDDFGGPKGMWKAGEKYDGFTDKKKLIRAAIRLFKKDPHGYDVLLLGDHCTCDPQKMLVGPKDVMLAANILHEEFESHNGWGFSYQTRAKEIDDQVKVICNKWDIVLGGKSWERD